MGMYAHTAATYEYITVTQLIPDKHDKQLQAGDLPLLCNP